VDQLNPETEAVQKVQTWLNERNYDGSILFSRETIRTVDDASRVVGVPPEEILKSLVLLADGEPVLALMSGPNRIDLKKVKTFLGVRKVSMAKPEWVFEYSGFRVGGVPPVGYIDRPRALLDSDLFRFETVWAAAGSDHAFFPVSPDRLLEFTDGEAADIRKG